MQGEDIRKRGGRGREWQLMHGEILIQDQRAKVAVTWANVGKVKWLYRQVVS